MVRDLTDSDSVLRDGVSCPEGPLGTAGITELDMDLDICITPMVVKAFPVIALEKPCLQREHVLSKEHVLRHNCKNLTRTSS